MLQFHLLLIHLLTCYSLSTLPGCDTFNGLDSCVGNNVNVDSSQDSRAWQTPPRGSSEFMESFQDYREITGYAHLQYNSDRQSAVIEIRAQSRLNSTLFYSFDGGNSFDLHPLKYVNSTFKNECNVMIMDQGGAKLQLEPIAFLWNNAPIHSSPLYRNGQRGAIVDLFGWPWKDIEAECPMLAKAGYMGVKINPPNEHLTTQYWLGNDNVLNPWYFIYQPVSYKLHARGGSRNELKSMVQTCRSLGVRVYADAVVNHMTGGGNDIQNHRNNQGSCVTWGPKNGTANSPFYTHSYTYEYNPYTSMRPGLEYPAVPYKPSDFHCERSLNSYTDPLILDAGWLDGLADLNTAKDSVQERIAQYMTDLLSFGFSGFRWDAAKHIAPSSIASILGKLKRNLGNSLPDDFITWLEVMIGGEKELLACEQGPYNFYQSLDDKMKSNGLLPEEIEKVKIWSTDYPKEHPICGYWVLPPSRFVIQNDDHDQENPGSSSRDMQDKGSVLLKDRDIQRHRYFETLLFSRTDADWDIKVVLSSFSYGPRNENGFLDGLSDCTNYLGNQNGCRTTPKVNAFDPNACGYSCFDDSGAWKPFAFTRVHRDKAIISAMRRWMSLPSTDDLGIPLHCH